MAHLQHPIDVAPLGGAAAGLSVAIDAPTGVIRSGGSPSPEDVDRFMASLRAELLMAGFDVVAEPSRPHDVTAKVSLDLHRDFVGIGPQEVVGHATLILLGGDGSVVDQASEAYDLSSASTPKSLQALWKEFPDQITSSLVAMLLKRSRIAEFAAAHRARAAAALASQAAPATAQPPAPVTASAPVSPTVNANGFTPGSPQPTAYAIVIGVERYSATLPTPTGARADARRFSELARSSLGVAADHVQTLFDEQATKASIERALASALLSVPAGGRIYFYFSGHGAPDASGGTPYIVPTDGDPQFLDATAIPMKEVLAKLGQSKAREVLAVVDSCFSGAGGRSVLPPGARPIVRVKEETAPAQLALFSASSGSEISGPTPSGDGGLFTQYVLQGLGTGAADMNGDGQVSLGELSQWVGPRVSREAKKANRDQNPSLTVGKGLGSADSFIVEWGLAAK